LRAEQLRAPWVKEWVSELVGFPQLPHDDRCDAASMALQRLKVYVEPYRAMVVGEVTGTTNGPAWFAPGKSKIVTSIRFPVAGSSTAGRGLMHLHDRRALICHTGPVLHWLAPSGGCRRVRAEAPSCKRAERRGARGE